MITLLHIRIVALERILLAFRGKSVSKEQLRLVVDSTSTCLLEVNKLMQLQTSNTSAEQDITILAPIA